MYIYVFISFLPYHACSARKHNYTNHIHTYPTPLHDVVLSDRPLHISVLLHCYSNIMLRT